MNIILTGPKQCGKSTVIRKFKQKYSGSISGFISEFDDRASDTRQLIIRSICSENQTCAVKWENGKANVNYSAFDEFAPRLIDLTAELILIDELGKFEASCKNLQAVVEDAFASSTTVIAVLRLDAPGWINALKSREDTLVIDVNSANRNMLVDKLCELIL